MMFNSTKKKAIDQIERLKMQFSQMDGLPFGDIVTTDCLIELLEKEGREYRDRIFPPIVTLSALFVSGDE